MADKTQTLMAEALTRALEEPAGLPLIAPKGAVGLFANNPAGKQAAQDCRDLGLLRILRCQTVGKNIVEYVGASEKGLAFLLEQTSARPIVQAILGAIERCEQQLHQTHKNLADLQASARIVFEHLRTPPSHERNGHSIDIKALILDQLKAWHQSGKLGDLPLPELFEKVKATAPKATIGQFHDALRLLHDEQKVYLHPWTGPLYEIPQPAFSLLVGHEIAYYASTRS